MSQTQLQLPGEAVRAAACQPGDVLYARDGWSEIGIVTDVSLVDRDQVKMTVAMFTHPTCADGCCGGTECGVERLAEFTVEPGRLVRRVVMNGTDPRRHMLRWVGQQIVENGNA